MTAAKRPKKKVSTLSLPNELEIETAELWLKQGTIWITDTGSENTYYIDQFDNQFFCKNL